MTKDQQKINNLLNSKPVSQKPKDDTNLVIGITIGIFAFSLFLGSLLFAIKAVIAWVILLVAWFFISGGVIDKNIPE